MRHFRLLVAGNALSAFGSYLNMVSLNVFIYQLTGSALSVGVFLAVRLLATVVAGFVSGALVSRYDGKRLLMGSDLVQAVALSGTFLVPGGARLVAVYAFAVVTGACSTLSQITLRSSIPEMVGAELRAAANGLVVTGRSLAMVAGFSSAGVLTAAFGYSAALLVDAATFAVSALVLSLLPLRTRADATTEGTTGKGVTEAPVPTTPALLRALPVIAAMIAVRAVDGLGSSSHNVALPIHSAALDAAHPAAFISQFWATWAMGNIVAQQVCGRFTRKTGRAPGERAFALGACVMSAAFILVFSGLPTLPAVCAALLAGMADGFTEIAYVTRLQEAPDQWRGRVFGLSAVAENTGFGLGMLVSATLLESYSPLEVVGAFHGLAIALCVALLAWLVPAGRRASRPPGAIADTRAADRTVHGSRVEGTSS
ncbi:MFS transporter [Streptomyces rhizosphaerihabitans]|uniref:MFS transporter n=1 Tax=Streptomyces rhizosphaerihabitans TaxID=1266770 RepID=UPI0021C0DDC1|nr:MFS transporter [Streptomyces rhizosphaerihabitans]MCT9008524.1 MFS transporter [Streptomyces rhizosphaerihabitans]